MNTDDLFNILIKTRRKNTEINIEQSTEKSTVSKIFI